MPEGPRCKERIEVRGIDPGIGSGSGLVANGGYDHYKYAVAARSGSHQQSQAAIIAIKRCERSRTWNGELQSGGVEEIGS